MFCPYWKHFAAHEHVERHRFAEIPDIAFKNLPQMRRRKINETEHDSPPGAHPPFQTLKKNKEFLVKEGGKPKKKANHLRSPCVFVKEKPAAKLKPPVLASGRRGG